VPGLLLGCISGSDPIFIVAGETLQTTKEALPALRTSQNKTENRSMTTTRPPAPAAFALAVGEGRTPHPLNILGSEILVKLSVADSRGAVAIFQHVVPPLWGPPLHRHSHEDEWFYVLQGEITVEIDGERGVLSAGESSFAPRGTAHSFRNFSDSAAEILVMAAPGRFNLFFEELASLGAAGSPPDPAAMERLMQGYGIELLGPPLS
jgi:mannose-6-phosphate isomerase-like protein (cupin superfamily)